MIIQAKQTVRAIQASETSLWPKVAIRPYVAGNSIVRARPTILGVSLAGAAVGNYNRPAHIVTRPTYHSQGAIVDDQSLFRHPFQLPCKLEMYCSTAGQHLQYECRGHGRDGSNVSMCEEPFTPSCSSPFSQAACTCTRAYTVTQCTVCLQYYCMRLQVRISRCCKMHSALLQP